MEIAFGALVDSINKQLKKQKLNFDKEEVKDFQRMANQILHLHFDGILLDVACKKARQRLMNKLTTHIKRHNKYVK